MEMSKLTEEGLWLSPIESERVAVRLPYATV